LVSIRILIEPNIIFQSTVAYRRPVIMTYYTRQVRINNRNNYEFVMLDACFLFFRFGRSLRWMCNVLYQSLPEFHTWTPEGTRAYPITKS